MNLADQIEQDIAGMSPEKAARYKAEMKKAIAELFVVSDAEDNLKAARQALETAEARVVDAQQHYDAVALEASNRQAAALAQAQEAFDREVHRPTAKLQAATSAVEVARDVVLEAEANLATVRAAHPEKQR